MFIICNYLRGHKHFLELTYSKHSVFKQMRLHEAKQTDTVIAVVLKLKFRLLCLLLSNCKPDLGNSTTFSILKLGTLHGDQHFYQSLVRS